MPIHSVDIVFSLLLLIASLRGWSKGLLGVAATWVAPVVAFLVASDWSEPVRESLAARMPDAEIFLDILAPVLVFILVVVAIRVAAGVLARALGVGRSLPGRVLAAAASVAVTALILGGFVVFIHELQPRGSLRIDERKEQNLSPVEQKIVELDQSFEQSLLAPPMARMARAALAEAMARRDELPLPEALEIEDAARRAREAADEFRRNPVLPVPALPGREEGSEQKAGEDEAGDKGAGSARQDDKPSAKKDDAKRAPAKPDAKRSAAASGDASKTGAAREDAKRP